MRRGWEERDKRKVLGRGRGNLLYRSHLVGTVELSSLTHCGGARLSEDSKC